FGGAVVNLAAVDGLGRWLRVRKGRLPRPCRPQSCELVLVGGQGPLPRLPFLRVVGRATLTADAPFDAYFGPSPRKQPPLLLVGGDIAVLLLAFAVLAATRLRRDSEAAWRRLTWFGARRGQLVTLSAVECGAIAAAAVVAGWAAGIGFAALLARHLGAPAGPVVAHSVAAPGALAL